MKKIVQRLAYGGMVGLYMLLVSAPTAFASGINYTWTNATPGPVGTPLFTDYWEDNASSTSGQYLIAGSWNGEIGVSTRLCA